jgi:hypothetical protein
LSNTLIDPQEKQAFEWYNKHRRKLDLGPVSEEEFSSYMGEVTEPNQWSWLVGGKITNVTPNGWYVNEIIDGENVILESHLALDWII